MPAFRTGRFTKNVSRVTLLQPFHRNPLEGSKVQFSCAQDWKRIDFKPVRTRGQKQIGQAPGRSFGQDLWNSLFGEGVQDGQLFPFAFIRYSGDGTDLEFFARCRLQGFFHLPMRNHFAADLGKT